MREQKPVLIQGAMDYETECYLSELDHVRAETHNTFRFWTGTLGERAVVISRTQVGMVNAAVATVLGVRAYSPAFVVNQGVAGGHRETVRRGDIVVGTGAININSFHMPARARGQGMDPAAWKMSGRCVLRPSDPALLAAFAAGTYTAGTAHCGILGSGDLFSREKDRIVWLTEQAGNLCEDMESEAVYRACQALEVPCIGVRAISNNELLEETYSRDTALLVRDFVLRVLVDKGL